MRRSTDFFLDELRELKPLIKPFLTYQLKPLDEESESPNLGNGSNFDDSLVTKIKNTFGSVGGRSSSRQPSRKSSSSSIDMLGNEPEALLHTLKGHFSTVYSCI
jgi:hypothetical protein